MLLFFPFYFNVFFDKKDTLSRAAISPCLDEISVLNRNHDSCEQNNCEIIMSRGNNIKKSKRDPIVEYDTELAKSIEYELSLKRPMY